MPSPSEKPKRHMGIFLSCLIILAALVGAGYFLGYHPGQTKDQSPVPAASQAQSP